MLTCGNPRMLRGAPRTRGCEDRFLVPVGFRQSSMDLPMNPRPLKNLNYIKKGCPLSALFLVSRDGATRFSPPMPPLGFATNAAETLFRSPVSNEARAIAGGSKKNHLLA